MTLRFSPISMRTRLVHWLRHENEHW